ncbi:MAG: phage tail tape measure protein, partial [Candidatus Cloacimonetes bacterium]|nr:phage tail tape measure protein [Candidatus Cloacimonadota bacterium]
MANQGAIRSARAFVEVFADDSRLVQGLRKAESKVKAFGARVNEIGMGLTKAAASILAPMTLSTKVFMGFDDQMRAVQATIGATGSQFDMLNEKAKLLGRTTSFTVAQVAAAMLELGRAGFAPQEIDDAIASVLNLSRATGTDLAESANIA